MFRATITTCPSAADMKRAITAVCALVLICAFSACRNANVNGRTPEQATTVYEQATTANSSVLTEENGETQHRESTAEENKGGQTSCAPMPESAAESNRETDTTQEGNSTTAAAAETEPQETTAQSVTDSDGWINKWY